jgi:hypothetical protein
MERNLGGRLPHVSKVHNGHDLEELLGQVRDAGAKEQVREAINCYNSGAYRSAIVSTWVAVVFDFVAKLRELDMTGNQAARTKLNAL